MDESDGAGGAGRDSDEGDDRFRALAESIDAVVMVTDLQSRMLYANPALERLTGFTVEDFQFAQADNPFIHRDDAAWVAAFIGEFVTGDAPRSREVENRFLDRWGRTLHCRSVISKVRYRGEPALQFVVHAVGPTPAAGGEAPPADGEYRALIEAADDAIVRLDAAGRVLFANPRTEALTGLSRVELGKRTLGELLDSEAAEGLAELLGGGGADGGGGSAADGGGGADGGGATADGGGAARSLHIAGRLVARGGGVRDVELGVASLARFGAAGEWLAIVRDVTAERAAAAERARLEQQLRDAQKHETIGGLAAGIAHDFNNLLAAVMTNVGLARADLARGGDAGARLDEIQRAADRAAALCRQLVAYTGRAPARVGTIDLHALADDVAHIMGDALLDRGVLRRVRGAAPATMIGDVAQVQQMVMSLIANACDALGDEGGEVVVETSVGGDGQPVLLRVRDTGSGMDEATRARMFDPYFTTKRFGRGLGLAGVLGVVRAHRGTIDVTSAPGRGTTVEVRLPASGTIAPSGPAPEPLDDPAAWHGAGTVIVADDEQAVRAAVAMVLADAGFTIVEADDGLAALDALAHHPDAAAIVLDATMPNLGGVDALRRLRAGGSTVPVILISGYQQAELAPAEDVELRPLEFLGKPFEVDELIAAVRRALDRRAPAAS